ncbi:MAG: ATP-grasp domain-containing protein [Elusimicrobia bacterium]|nr:ATP-grasp domain-containing protein [Elusimicrobiota bacterium]
MPARKVLASLLAALAVVFSPGLAPYQALAALSSGGTARAGAAGEAGGAGAAFTVDPARPQNLPALGPQAQLQGPLGLELGAVRVPGLPAPTLPPAAAADPGGPAAAAPSENGEPADAARAAAQAPSEAARPALASEGRRRPFSRAAAWAGGLLHRAGAGPRRGLSPGSLDRFYEGRARAGGEPRAPAVAAREKAGVERAGGLLAPPPNGAAGEAAKPGPAAPSVAKPSPFSRLAQTLDLSQFDASQKAYLLGQAAMLFAKSVYLSSLPLLVTALTGSTALLGVSWSVYYGVFAVASLVTGEIVRATPMRGMLVGTASSRAVLVGAIGGLTALHFLSPFGFVSMIGLTALVVAFSNLVDIDTAGAGRVFPKEKLQSALYFYATIRMAMLLVFPPILGIGMDLLDSAFGAGVGATSGFGFFGLVIGAAAYLYSKVKVKGDVVWKPIAGLRDALARLPGALAFIGKSLWETPRRTASTARLMISKRTVLVRAILATFEAAIDDAVFYVVLPIYAVKVLAAGGFGNGLLLASVFAGGLVAGNWMRRHAQKAQARIGAYNFLRILTGLAAFAFVPSIGLWAFPGLIHAAPLVLHLGGLSLAFPPALLLAVPAFLLLKAFYLPIQMRMQALLQETIEGDAEAKKQSENIFGLMTSMEVAAASASAYIFGWMFDHSGPATVLGQALGSLAPMKAVTLTLAAMSVVYLAGLRWMRRQLAPETLLAANLAKLGLPKHRTEVVTTPVDDRRPTSVLLVNATTHKLAVAREGGRQSPGDVLLALDPSWVEKRKGPDGEELRYLKKGVYFDAGGQAVVAEFRVPRRIRYWANFFTPVETHGRVDGLSLDENQAAPQSNSVALEDRTNDKIRAHLLHAARGVAVPAMLGFLMAGHDLAADPKTFGAHPGGNAVAPMPAADAGRRAEFAARLDAYLAGLPESGEVVVKPSGARWHSSEGVRRFGRGQREEMLDWMIGLADRLEPHEGLLVERRVDSLPLQVEGRKMEASVRVLVARTPWDGAEVGAIFPRVGPWGKLIAAEAPNPADNALPMRWDALLKAWNLPEEEARALDAEIRARALTVFASIAEDEKKRERRPGEPLQAQTDLIGLDIMVERRNGKPTPVLIEVNGHDSGGQYHMERLLEPERAGEHSRAWVATMLARARRDALKGKRIVLVGAGYPGNPGYPGKRLFFERARELGVRVLLVDQPGSWAAKLVDEFIPVDTVDPAKALKEAFPKLLASGNREKLDGITSFWENDLGLTASLAKTLGLSYHPLEAVEAARNKFALRKLMKDAGLPSPEFAVVRTQAELQLVLSEGFPFPAVMKPARGAAAMGTVKVGSAEEALAVFDRILRDTDPGLDSIFAQGREILLDEYLDGPEGDADIVRQDGKIAYSSLTDNWPTQEPSFLATGSSLPSRSLTEQQKRESMELIARALEAAGFGDGVFHVEFKYTSKGPRLIEVNARPGGVYVVAWNLAVNGVDLAEMLFLTAAGIPAVPYRSPAPRTYLEGAFVNPDASGKIARFRLGPGSDEGLHELLTLKREGETIAVPPDGYDRAGMLTAEGATAEEARKNLERHRERLQLSVE